MTVPMRLILFLICACLWTGAQAQDDADIQRRLSNVTMETGLVRLSRANARIEIPPGWRFLSVENLARGLQVSTPTQKLSELGWLVAEGVDLGAKGAWAVQLYLAEDGVIEHDEDDLDPYRLVWRTRDAYRVATWGLGLFKDQSFEFVNFARAPIFDRDKGRLLWSERIRYPSDDRAIYLDIYAVALYRRGAVVAYADYIPEAWQDAVESATQALIASIKFDAGERYNDVGPADPRAGYMMSHLVSGELWFDVATDSWWDVFWRPIRLPRALAGENAFAKRIKVPQGPLILAGILVGMFALRKWIIGGASKPRAVPPRRAPRR